MVLECGDSGIRHVLMEGSERVSGSKATLQKLDSSVLFEFEVRPGCDPGNLANFKFNTLGSAH
jgi:hypothetical protein